MINETESAGLGAEKQPEKKWNSDEQAIPGFTCEEAARFMTAYITAFRLMAESSVNGGTKAQLYSMIRLLELQWTSVYGDSYKGCDKDNADKNIQLGIASVSLATIANLMAGIPLEQLVRLTTLATNATLHVTEISKEALNAGILRFGVRIVSGDEIEVGCKIIPHSEMDSAIKESGIDKMIKKMDEGKNPQNN